MGCLLWDMVVAARCETPCQIHSCTKKEEVRAVHSTASLQAPYSSAQFINAARVMISLSSMQWIGKVQTFFVNCWAIFQVRLHVGKYAATPGQSLRLHYGGKSTDKMTIDLMYWFFVHDVESPEVSAHSRQTCYLSCSCCRDLVPRRRQEGLSTVRQKRVRGSCPGKIKENFTRRPGFVCEF